jgi:hypothetical protein
MRQVPIRNKDGVIAHALIDDEDLLLVTRYSWVLDHKGYAVTPRGLRMARLIMDLPKRDPCQVDHRNRVKLDNQRSNLRLATSAQNAQNRPPRRGSSSRHRGVGWYPKYGKWRARAMLDGRSYLLGYFDDEQTAAQVVQAWRAEHMPFSEEA